MWLVRERRIRKAILITVLIEYSGAIFLSIKSYKFASKLLQLTTHFCGRMSTAPALPEPFRVSPLIRVGRWSLLGLGVLYGISRQRTLSKRETAYRAQVEAERPAKEAAQAKEKARLNRAELLYLAEATGTKVPPNF